MNRLVRNTVSSTFPNAGSRWRLYRGGLALLAALCLSLVPACARAACGSFGPGGSLASIHLPAVPHAAIDNDEHFDNPTIVGLWHVIYTNSANQSTFNDTFDTWHSDGTEFESAYLAPAAGDVCVGVWKKTNFRSVKLHHVGWLFNPANPTATATNTFTLDQEVTVAEDNKSYRGRFTFKVWNLDGSATPVEVTGTMVATRITPD